MNDLKIPVDIHVRQAWEDWIPLAKERCHIAFELEGGSIYRHMESALGGALRTVSRIVEDIDIMPRKILEVGCSVGLKTIAAAHIFPDAEVVGLDPDREAIQVARAMAVAANVNNAYFETGVGESLPFPDEGFDLIICHTVIEHVQDVEQAISEMCRVLMVGGILRLEAPNYIFPFEPHLCIWCLPVLGKRLLKLAAMLQGKRQHIPFIDTLQLVTPGWIEREFERHALSYESRVNAKLSRIISGGASEVERFRKTAAFLKLFGCWGGGILFDVVDFTRIYPSMLYTARKMARSG